MSEKRVAQKMVRNIFWLAIGETINGLLMFFLTIWLARYLGADGYGKLTFSLNLVALFAILADFGLSPLAVREIARRKEKTRKYLDNIVTIKIVLSIITFGLIVLIIQFLGKDSEVVALIYLLSLWRIFYSALLFLQSVFRAHEKMQYEALTRIIHVLILVIVVIFLIWQKYNVVMFGWAYCTAGFIGLFLGAIIVWRKFSHFGIEFDFIFWRSLLKESWPFALSLIFISIYYYMDSVMLGIMGKDQEVGWYNAAYKPIFFILILGSILSNCAFPIISRLYKESLIRLKEFLNNFARLMTFIALPLAFGGTALALPIINLIYGQEYLKGVLAFQILIWTAAVIYISIVYAPSLQACNRQKVYLFGVGVGAFINIILNFLLIPKFSLYGAAVATLLTETFVFVFVYIQFNRVVSIKIMKHILKPFMASVIMFILLYFLKNLNLFVLLILGVVIYLVIMLAIKGISFRDFSLIKEVFIKSQSYK